MREYYDRRAPEYDEWYLGAGLFAARDRPGWPEEVEALTRVIEELPAGRVLDVACGTGFLTQHLRGDVVGIDQSARMLDEARRRVARATFLQADAFSIPFPETSFDRLFTGHFYGHLRTAERGRFLAEAARVAGELVVVDASRASSGLEEELSERTLNDGSTWEVYKRWFTGDGLAAELGGGDVLHDGRYFVVVRAPL